MPGHVVVDERKLTRGAGSSSTSGTRGHVTVAPLGRVAQMIHVCGAPELTVVGVSRTVSINNSIPLEGKYT